MQNFSNRRRNRRLAAVGLAAVAVLAAACSSSKKSSSSSSSSSSSGSSSATTAAPARAAAGVSLTIGGFNFAESTLLVYVYGDALKAAGANVTEKTTLGTRQTLEPGIQSGQIDMLPEYAASALEFVDNKAGLASGDIRLNIDHLETLLQPKGVSVLTPSSAIDTNAFAVTKATAQKYNLAKMSDLSAVGNKLTLGGPAECETNAFCIPGLTKTYGITFRAFKVLDAAGPLTYTALTSGNVDVGEVFSTDALAAADNLVVLQDDKNLQAADAVVPIIRTNKATDGVKAITNKVSAALTTDILRGLNKSVTVDKQDPQAVADAWLKSQSLM